MSVSRDVKDSVADTGVALVRREGVLGFAAIVASLMLGAFMWQGWKQNELIVEVLEKSQILQTRTLDESKARDEAMKQYADALELLGKRSLRAADNLDRLVAIFLVQAETSAAFQGRDEQRTKAVLARLDALVSATGLSIEELQRIRGTMIPEEK